MWVYAGTSTFTGRWHRCISELARRIAALAVAETCDTACGLTVVPMAVTESALLADPRCPDCESA